MSEIKYLQNGCGMIAEERMRQIDKEGWSADHDDGHTGEELRDAGIAYAVVCDDRADNPPNCWPFEMTEWKPIVGNKPYNLVKAGALYAAEIDRHRRAFQRRCNEITMRDFGFEAFDEMDAYDLERTPWVLQSPEEFIAEHFAEDYATLAIRLDEEERDLEEQAAEEGGDQ